MAVCIVALFMGGVQVLTAVGLLLTGKAWQGPGLRVTYRCPHLLCGHYLSTWRSPGIGEYARCPHCKNIIRGEKLWL
jgi:hypothetical protein